MILFYGCLIRETGREQETHFTPDRISLLLSFIGCTAAPWRFSLLFRERAGVTGAEER